MADVVAPDHAGAVRQAVGVLVAGRAQQDRRRVERAGRDDHDVGRILRGRAVTLGDDLFHDSAGGVGLQACNERPGDECHVAGVERRIDADHMRIGLGLGPSHLNFLVSEVK